MAEKFSKYNPVDYLKTERDIKGYLLAAFEDGNPEIITAAIGDVARACGISKLARNQGVDRAGLYRALSKKGNPLFRTIVKTLDACGFELYVRKKQKEKESHYA